VQNGTFEQIIDLSASVINHIHLATTKQIMRRHNFIKTWSFTLNNFK